MRFSLLFLVGLLTACQPIPQPFSHQTGQPPEILALPDASGVTVLPIARAPEPTATELSRAMAAALRDDNIPAATFGGNRATLFLQGSVDDDGQTASLVWELFDGDGELLGSHSQPIDGTPVELWQSADPALLTALAAAAAPQVATMIRPPTEVAANTLALALPPITGGQPAAVQNLHTSMRQALTRQASVVITGDAAYALRGNIDLGPLHGQNQDIAITWSLFDAAEQRLGSIVQSNTMPVDTASGDWSALAPEIAAAAIPGILDLIGQLDLR